MTRKTFRRIARTFLVILACSLLLAQFIMKYRIPDEKAKKDFLNQNIVLNTAKFDASGFELHYAKVGNDTLPTLFFVHGSPDSWSRFGKYMQDKDLLSRFRMIAIDRPGFGYSEFGEAKNLEEQSKLISQLLITIKNGKPVYAIGHSYGGAVVVRLQTDNNNLFDGLVLLAAAVDPKKEKPEKWRHVMKIPPLKYFLPGAFRPSNTELVYLKKDLEELEKEWGKISCLVWILHGDKDTYVPVSNADYAKKKLVNVKNVEVKILPGAGHFITQERYEDVKEWLLKLPI